ncbi:MAG: 50S ribosomal protein L19 [Candidatus Omnitrophica bacterium]|nr:50S ribosomal protein L19 [Candidatus Omnitrophota bacterium]
MEWLKHVHRDTPVSPGPEFGPGDEVRVWYRIIEQGKERLGQFEGTVIRHRGAWPSQTFTVRRVTYGEGVERVFPLDAKIISRIEVLRKGKVKRARLYFLRDAVGKTRIASAEGSASMEKSAGGSVTSAKPSETEADVEKAEGAVPSAPNAAGSVTPRA